MKSEMLNSMVVQMHHSVGDCPVHLSHVEQDPEPDDEPGAPDLDR